MPAEGSRKMLTTARLRSRAYEHQGSLFEDLRFGLLPTDTADHVGMDYTVVLAAHRRDRQSCLAACRFQGIARADITDDFGMVYAVVPAAVGKMSGPPGRKYR